MSKNAIGTCGVVVFLVGVFLPFMGFNGGILALLMTVICFAVGGGLLLLAINPQWFKRYVMIAGALLATAVVVIAMVIAVMVAGVFLKSGPSSVASSGTSPEPQQVVAEQPQ